MRFRTQGEQKMRRFVYLFELDSVRNSKKEIQRGQQALFEEIVKKGNTVVLSFRSEEHTSELQSQR